MCTPTVSRGRLRLTLFTCLLLFQLTFTCLRLLVRVACLHVRARPHLRGFSNTYVFAFVFLRVRARLRVYVYVITFAVVRLRLRYTCLRLRARV